MSAFSELLRRVRVKSIKVGPVTWDVLPAEKLPIPVPATVSEKVAAPDPDMRNLNEIINALENFHTNPESIYYIGQTLVQCDSFLMDNGIIGEPLELCKSLIDQMDSDPRVDEGLFDPRLSIAEINKLKRSLKKFRDDILRFE